MKNKILLIIFFIITTLIFPHSINAQEKASASSANIKTSLNLKGGSDYRVKVLKAYLSKHDSPLTDNAKDFVDYADKYNLDWKLVAAISGVESTFGKAIPPDSYNGWGWGVYGTNVIRFNSWEEGIKTVSQGLRERYMDSWGGKDIYEIGAVYASSPAWADHVEHYLNDISEFALNDPGNALSLSL